MRIVDLIEKKRDGGTHSRDELEAIVGGYVRGELPDYSILADSHASAPPLTKISFA